MKKVLSFFLFLTLSAGMIFSATLNSKSNTRNWDQWEDKIDISRHGGSTRVASEMSMRSMSSLSTHNVSSNNVIIEAYGSKDLVTVYIENHCGAVGIEIVGSGGAQQSYFEVYDMGFEAINIGDLRPGKYTIRIIIGSEVYTGAFNKRTYGR